ncbi:hypothetical protein HCI31_00050 [Escherichia coli]|nr:hypothetical protein [Escherichia coli]MBI0707641.1 hypothetical protein [Escherichia coli]MBI0944480.1 hypothetical protein [Escherichia coli]MBI1141655.1 hypothetical protein [Escherichia coli]
MRYLTELICQLYRLTDHHKLTAATFKNLADIKLVEPTADADTILQLENIFSEYSLRYIDRDLAEILSNIITTDKNHSLDFDFNKIQFLTASKSFGCGWNKVINGSWFKNLYSWGEGMYPAKNLKAENISDWEDNIWHIEHEGFNLRDPINVKYYSWLDRYVALNSGGSHHAAMVVYQSVRDKLEYKREAVIEQLSINSNTVEILGQNYYSFIFQIKHPSNKTENYTSEYEFTDALKDFGLNRHTTLKPVNYVSNIKLAFIPKDALKTNSETFRNWFYSAISYGKIISLPDYLKNPAHYHTYHYSHELDSITLGNPSRKYKLRGDS